MEGAFQAVRLPYGESERLAMYVFLPDEDSSILEFTADLSNEGCNQWKNEFQRYQGNLKMPRFSMKYEETLKNNTSNYRHATRIPLGINGVFLWG